MSVLAASRQRNLLVNSTELFLDSSKLDMVSFKPVKDNPWYKFGTLNRKIRVKWFFRVSLTPLFSTARVAELVDAQDLKSWEGNLVPVRFRPSAFAIREREISPVAPRL